MTNEDREYVGTYRFANKPNQNVPVFYNDDGDYVNMLGTRVNIDKMIKVED